MQSLKTKHFKINTNEKSRLVERGFRFSQRYDGVDFGSPTFPCYSWKRKPVLWCGVIVNTSSKNVELSVVDENGMAYAPWYNDKYSTGNLVISIVNHNIVKKLKSLGIKEVTKNDDKYCRMRKKL